jgi:hypothetical protein
MPTVGLNYRLEHFIQILPNCTLETTIKIFVRSFAPKIITKNTYTLYRFMQLLKNNSRKMFLI